MDLRTTLTQDQFNRMVMDLVQRTFKVCDEALQSARLTAADVDAVILVGGPTRLPIVQNSVRHYFQKEPAGRHQPGPGGGDGRGAPGARADGRQDRDLPGRRHPAHPAHRDGGRLHRADHREEHPGPHRSLEDLHHQPRRPGAGEDPRLPGRVEPGGRVRDARRVRVRRVPGGLPGRGEDRGHLRDQHRRHRERLRRGPRDGPEDLDHHLALLRPERGGHPAVHPAEPADTAGPGCDGAPGPAWHLA